MARHRDSGRLARGFQRAFALDEFLEWRVNAWSPVVIGRMVLMVVLAIATQFTGADAEGAVSVALVGGAALQPVLASWYADGGRTWRLMFAGDLVIATIVGALEPSLVTNYLIVLTGLLGAAATCYAPRGFLLFGGASLAGATVVTARAEVAQPAQLVVLTGVVGIGFGGWMVGTRLVAQRAVEDREHAVDAAGGVFFTSAVGESVVRVEGRLEALLGWSDRDDDRIDLRKTIHPDDFDDYWIPDDDLYAGAELDRTARFRTSAGGWKWIREVSMVTDRGGELVIRGLMLDHTDHLDGLMRAKTEASTDQLTGLGNRRLLETVLDQPAASDRWVVLLDVDGFKRVNDTLGHDAGDQLLIAIARRIANRLRSSDLVVRLGGDEFALVFADELDVDGARATVERILLTVAQPVEIHSMVIDVGLSAGLVQESGDVRGARSLLRRADLALYDAKRRVSHLAVFQPEMEASHRRKGQLVQDLPRAVANGDLRLFFQPVMNVAGTRVEAAEGLARWDHPDFGMLTPGDFIDVVLMSSHASAFTRAMVDHALEMVRFTTGLGLDLDIAVNVPMTTIEDPAFAAWFFERCAELGVDVRHLVLEVSERELHNAARSADAIAEFTARGVTVSIDDFGTGHATFERLRWASVLQLKLDHRVVQGAAVDRRDHTIVRSVVAMAHELGYAVVGEGVETEEQRSMLARFGVDLVQGYLFAPALDRDDFVAFARGVAVPGVTAR